MLADLDLAPKLRLVSTGLKSGAVWVHGPTGSGRSELAKRLAAEREAITVEPPGLHDVDAPVHALAQCAVDAESARIAFDETRSLFDRATELARRAREMQKLLVVRAPSSWEFGALGENADELRRRDDVLQVIKGWLKGTTQVVLLTNTLDDADPIAALFPNPVYLTRVSVRDEALEDSSIWGSGPYGDAAKALQKELRARRTRLTPLQVRLSVGLIALGEEPKDLLRALEAVRSKSALEPLAERLQRRLQRAQPSAWLGLQAIAQARFPLATNEAIALSELPAEHETLLTQCIGYGAETLRLPEPVRRALLEQDDSQAAQVSHQALSWHYQQADGAVSPDGLAGPTLTAWLEKAHHLAHLSSTQAEVDGRQRWEQLDCPARHLLWDRARFLSKQARRYEEAAKLYRVAIERFGDDDYSWHYLGFNLDKAGARREQTEPALRAAVAPVWPDDSANAGARNPWWNARLVTFLIRRARPAAAEQAWDTALEAIDPDGSRSSGSSWLARHFHKWVIREWLDAGEVRRARAVFNLIPEKVVEAEDDLALLRWRLLDAEEALELVESVYPASTVPAARWKRPQVSTGESLVSWAPGRVVSADKNGVTIVMAALGPAGPERRVVRARVTAAEWRRIAWGQPSHASGFVELHVLEGGARRILPVTAALPPWASRSAPA